MSSGLRRTIELAEPILAGLGFGAGRVATIETDDPDDLGEALRAIPMARDCSTSLELPADGRQAIGAAVRIARASPRRACAGGSDHTAGASAFRSG